MSTNRETSTEPEIDRIPSLLSVPEYAADYAKRFRARFGFYPIAGGDDPEPDDDGNVKVPKSELDELKRTVATKDREARDAKKKLGEQDERLTELEEKLEKAEDGDDERKQLERRLAKFEERLEEESNKRKEAEQQLEAGTKERTAVGVAERLNFRNPRRAIRLIDSEDLETEADTERALEKLAREEPYLTTSKRQRDVEDPKPRKKGDGDHDDDDDREDRESRKKGDDEDQVKGPARIRSYYEKQEREAEKAASGSDDAD